MKAGLWFTLATTRGNATSSTTTASNALDGSHKPAWDAFQAVATRGDQLTGPCGDFDAPSLTISSRPRASVRAGADHQRRRPATRSVARMTFQADGAEIRNFTGADVASGKVVNLEWQARTSSPSGPTRSPSSRRS